MAALEADVRDARCPQCDTLASGKITLGCLISDFNFTSKTLLVKVILLVKLDQHSKKDFE